MLNKMTDSKKNERLNSIIESRLVEMSNSIKVPKKLLIRKGRSIYGEKFYYTDSTCFKNRFRFSYYIERYSKNVIINIVEYEYEANEFYFEGTKAFDEFINTISLLLIQLKKINERNIVFSVRINDGKDIFDDDIGIHLSFFKYRNDCVDMCKSLISDSDIVVYNSQIMWYVNIEVTITYHLILLYLLG